MNRTLFAHTWRMQRTRLAVVSLGLAVWGFITPVMYAEFGAQFRGILDSGMMSEELARLGGGDILSLPGAIALAFIHPLAAILTSVFSVGFSSGAVAGERQRGTLEVALARPISRRTLYATLLAASFSFVSVLVTAILTGSLAGSTFEGVLGELALSRLPLVWLNAVLLFGLFSAIGLAASVSFDRFAPALGVTLAILIVSYFFEVLGSLWPDAEFLQPYSLFHYLQPRAILQGDAAPFDFALLTICLGAAIGWALVVFPRRDLPAPS